MKRLKDSERFEILKQIIRHNLKILFPVIALLVTIGAVATVFTSTSTPPQAYFVPNSPVSPTKTVAKTEAKAPLQAVPNQTPEAKPVEPVAVQQYSSTKTPKTPPIAVTPPQNTTIDSNEFTIKNGITSGWTMTTNVILSLNLSFKPNYDNNRPVTVSFTPPAGYSCPSITILPFTTEQSAEFVCYLPDNITLGHKHIGMSATNGNTTSNAAFDLNVTSPTSQSN